MKPLLVSLKLREMHHLKNLLQSAGIRCRLRNETLLTLAGEAPFTGRALRLELEDETDRDRANAVRPRYWGFD